jgi:peptide/nickel transport system permease protein
VNLIRTRFSFGFLGLLVFISVFADFLSSNPPAMQNLDSFYQPPSRLHFFGTEGRSLPAPFICETELIDPLNVIYKENPATAHKLRFFFRGYRYRLLGIIPLDLHLAGRAEKPFYYPFGTDELGRDVLARVLAGTRTSLLVVLIGMAVYSLLGTTIGGLAGLAGGWADSLLMRLSELVMALPALYLVLALRALSPIRIPFWKTLLITVGVIAAVAWPPMARGVRGLVLQLKSSVYVEAARSLGGSRLHIFLRHMLPSILPFAVTQTALAAPTFLLGEVVLSFLNVGFRDSGESWGSMLRNLRDTRVLSDFWWNLLPLCMVFFTLLSLNLLSGRVRSSAGKDELMRI